MSSPINMEILNQLREILGEDFALILDSFNEEGEKLMEVMAAAVADDDMNQIKEAAHSMKSMSGNVGAMLLSELSDQMQNASAAVDAEKVQQLWPEIQAQYPLVLNALNEIG